MMSFASTLRARAVGVVATPPAPYAAFPKKNLREGKDPSRLGASFSLLARSLGRIRGKTYLGKTSRGIEVWESRDLITERDSQGREGRFRMFLAFDRAEDVFVGFLEIVMHDIRPDLDFVCARDLRTLAEKTSVATFEAYAVSASYLDPDYRGVGIGVALYLAATAAAARDKRAMLADVCFGSQTSEEALRVWQSKAFQKHALVGPSGVVATLRPKGG
jgi:GNAT superfamily N-acetyltransferase